MTPDEFEDEVRRVARALWPTASAGGAEMVTGRAGRDEEVDGLFYTDEVVHMVEATMDKRVDKARKDGTKLQRHLKRHRSGSGRFAKSWFVTYHEPTADQRKVLKDFDPAIQAISFDQFRRKLIDGREYLRLRDNAPWGSAVDPATGSYKTLATYIPMTISEMPGGAPSTSNYTVDYLAECLTSGESIALVGDYGAGKSVTLREVHRTLADRYLKGAEIRFPVTLSLRAHYGQTDPAEALHRHARQIGFPSPHQLVEAWRAGYLHILLDGFDELATQAWSGSPERLRENRRAATTLVREFNKGKSPSAGTLVAGRRFYFDSIRELAQSIFNDNRRRIFALSDFNAEQMRAFLHKFEGQQGALPAWIPGRPLLISHLATAGLIEQIGAGETLEMGPAEGWDWLLTKICERESFIKNGMDGKAVREILERLASVARHTSQGVGPLSPFDLVDAFTKVRRQRPSDEELTLLQRLPGLGGREDSEEGTRSFIDADLASAAQAGDVLNFLNDPYQKDLPYQPLQWTSSLEPLGAQVVAELASQGDIEKGRLRAALSRAISSGLDVLAADLVQTAIERRWSISADADGAGFLIAEVVIPALTLDEDGPDLSAVTFSQCVFSEVSIEGDPAPETLPRFADCYISSLYGRLGENDLPSSVFMNCEIDELPELADRNAAVLKAESLPLGTRVTMTLLRKLYLQRGSGRKDSGLTRGMSQQEASLVKEALQLLQRERLVYYSKQGTSVVWMPDRSAGPRVRAYLQSPRLGEDPLMLAARNLGTKR